MADRSLAQSSVADDVLLRQPIIVLGAPRSGNTAMARILAADSDVALLNEKRLVWRVGNDEKSDLLERSDARLEVQSHIRATFARMVREEGKRRFVEKTPHNSLRVPFVDAVFPDCRFVHMVRYGPDSIAAIRRKWLETPHGLNRKQRKRMRRHLGAVRWRQIPKYAAEFGRQLLPRSMASVVGRRTWGPQIPGVESLLEDLDLLEVCALQWRMCIEHACFYGRRLGPDRYLECRIEDLTPEKVKEIAVFCDLDPAAISEAFSQRYDPSLIISRSRDLEPAELERVMMWIEPTLRYLGQD